MLIKSGRLVRLTGATATFLVAFAAARISEATYLVWQHNLNTWDIHLYNQITDSNTGATTAWMPDWCPGCSPDNSEIFGANLYSELYTFCHQIGGYCAGNNSYTFSDSSVTVNNFHSHNLSQAPGLSVFVGLGESIRQWDNPTYPNAFRIWVPWDNALHQISAYYSGYWTATYVGQDQSQAWQDWGTPSLALFYHQRGTEDPNATGWSVYRSKGIWDAQLGSQTPVQPGGVCWGMPWLGANAYCATSGTSSATSYGVQYMYNANTSVLFGQDYQSPNIWYTENTVNQASPDARGGSLDFLFWVIANTNLVPVARYATMNSNSGLVVASDQGRQQWMKSWGGLHSVLGHYAETEPDCMPNMYMFADNMMSSLDMVDSYFNAHASGWAKCHDPSHGGYAQAAALGPDGNVLWNETWPDPMTPWIVAGAPWTMYYEVAQ